MAEPSPKIEAPSDADTIYRRAFKNAEGATAIVDATNGVNLIDATDKFLEIWRFERGEVVGRSLEAIFPKGTATKLKGLVRKALSDGRVSAELRDVGSATAHFPEVTLRGCHLSETWVLLTVTTRAPLGVAGRNALIDDLGRVSGGLIYIYDLTRQKTRHIDSNLARLLGFGDGASIELKEVLPLAHPDDRAELERHVAEFGTLADGQIARAAFRIKDANGEWRWIENRAGPFARGANGEIRRVIGYAFDVTGPRRTSEHLAEVANALLQVEEKERRRIARELHDSTAQHLVAADLTIGAFVRKHPELEDPSLGFVRQTLAAALREIRTLSFLLHPPGLKEDGLASTLPAFAKGFADRGGLELELEINVRDAQMSPAVELALFRVAQEALMNVRRHAKATKVAVRLATIGNQAMLEVEDDGTGLGDITSIAQGVGISGMRARLASVGGRLEIVDQANGTLLRAMAPRTGA
jgi:signal transduction histidine kinase